MISALLGGIWRRVKGSTDGGKFASYTYPLICMIPVCPLLLLNTTIFMVGCVLSWILTGLYILYKADNGGNGKPLRRFLIGGFGYYLAGKYQPEYWNIYGEIFLGAFWFGLIESICWVGVYFYG